MLERSLSDFGLQKAYCTVYEAGYTRVMHNLGKAKGHLVHWYGSVFKQLIIFPTAKKEDFFFYLKIFILCTIDLQDVWYGPSADF